MTVRKLLSALLVVLTGLTLAVVASDPASAAGTPTLRLRDPGLPCEGQPSWIAGSGFVPGKVYGLYVNASWSPYTTTTAGSDGTLQVQLPIAPNARTAGPVDLYAEGNRKPKHQCGNARDSTRLDPSRRSTRP